MSRSALHRVRQRRQAPVARERVAEPVCLVDSIAMGFLKFLGAAILVLWLVLWLAVKITVGAIHLLALAGLALIIVGFVKASAR